MAASEPDPRSNPLTPGPSRVPVRAGRSAERMEEEINRAGRHGTPLSCLLVVIDNIEELSREHGARSARAGVRLPRRSAWRASCGGFDRIGRPSDSELLLLLPGADGPRGEMVARRVLERLRTIKVEAEGMRRPLRVSVGLAAWRRDVSAEELLAQARAATRREQAEDAAAELATATPLQSGSPPALGRPRPS